MHSETLVQNHYYQRCLIISVIQDTPLCLHSSVFCLFSGYFSYCLPQVCAYTRRIAVFTYRAPVPCKIFFKILENNTLYSISCQAAPYSTQTVPVCLQKSHLPAKRITWPVLGLLKKKKITEKQQKSRYWKCNTHERTHSFSLKDHQD